MSFDPNLYSGQGENYMSSESFLEDFHGLADNEDSVDIANLINSTGSGNFENCEEDLFKSLFPIYSLDNDLKKEECENTPSHSSEYLNPESCQQYLQSGPTSSCVSACSSATASPIPFQHPFQQTPPISPPCGEKSLLRQHLQINGTTDQPATTMSSTQYSVMQEPPPPPVEMNRQRYEAQRSLNMNQMELQHHPQQQHKTEANSMSSLVIKSEHKMVPDYAPIKQEGSVVDMDMPLALTTDRTKQPLSSNLNMSNKRPSVSCQQEEPRSKKSKAIAKGTPEYIQKRERNNVAVRRSRDKAKRKALETQEKVQSLAEENKMLREEVKKLTNEVNTLKSLVQSISQYSNVKT